MKTKIYFLMNALFFLMSSKLLAEGEEALPPDQSLWQTAVMIGIAFAFFYVILWRPEQKRRKALDEKRGAMKQGDRVAAMGILGTVVRVKEDTVILKMYDGAKLEFYKAAVTDILPESSSEGKKGEGKEGSDTSDT